MLPTRSRVHRPGEFRAVVRRGVRAGRPSVVVHAATVPQTGSRDFSTGAVDNHGDDIGLDPRVGFVVSKAVGNAVARNRVKRRLRHLSRDLLVTTPEGTLLVVRALPGASAHPDRLVADLDAAWSSALRKLKRGRVQRGTPERGSGAGRSTTTGGPRS